MPTIGWRRRRSSNPSQLADLPPLDFPFIADIAYSAMSEYGTLTTYQHKDGTTQQLRVILYKNDGATPLAGDLDIGDGGYAILSPEDFVGTAPEKFDRIVHPGGGRQTVYNVESVEKILAGDEIALWRVQIVRG